MLNGFAHINFERLCPLPEVHFTVGPHRAKREIPTWLQFRGRVRAFEINNNSNHNLNDFKSWVPGAPGGRAPPKKTK